MTDLPFHFFTRCFLLCSRREKCRYSCKIRSDHLREEPAEGGFEVDPSRFALGGGLMARVTESALRFILLYKQRCSSDTTNLCDELPKTQKDRLCVSVVVVGRSRNVQTRDLRASSHFLEMRDCVSVHLSVCGSGQLRTCENGARTPSHAKKNKGQRSPVQACISFVNNTRTHGVKYRAR